MLHSVEWWAPPLYSHNPIDACVPTIEVYEEEQSSHSIRTKAPKTANARNPANCRGIPKKMDRIPQQDVEPATEPDPGPSAGQGSKARKAHELVSCTIRSPPFSYLHLERTCDGADQPELDALQVRAYCTSAMTQFLGVTGAAIPVDILKVDATECWLRVPRPDLGAFAAAITAWPGVSQEGEGSSYVLRIRACGDWLGSLVGRQDQHKLWTA